MARHYRISEIATLCDITRDGIYKARSRGKFPNAEWNRFARMWKLPRKDVEIYLWKSHRLKLSDLEGQEDDKE